MNFKINSLYVCVKDMDRAIKFYENLLEQKVTEKSEIYSVFDINGFRYGLFAFEKMHEEHNFGNSCLPSIAVSDMDKFMEKLKELKCKIPFQLSVIGENKVLEFIDSEGNQIEATCRINKEE